MRIFDEDQRAMLEVYLYESNSLFDQLDTILMRTESRAVFTSEDIHSVFRIMHTTKSSSSMMNLQAIADLMHAVEDLFSLFREDAALMAGHEQQTFALLYAVSDYMHEQLRVMQEEDYQPGDTSSYVQQTKQLISTIQNAKPAIAEIAEEPMRTAATLKELSASDSNQKEEAITQAYIRLRFDKDSRMENIRAYMIASQIRGKCRSLSYYPQELEQDAGTAQFIKEKGFYLHIEAAELQSILKLLHRALFVESCEIIEKEEYDLNCGQPQRKEAGAVNPHTAESTSIISVQVEKLNQLQNLTGELMIAESAMVSRLEELGQKELLSLFENSFHKVLLDMEEIVMAARLVPISQIVAKLHRVVRDIAHKEHKDVSFQIFGEDIELDKEIVDNLFEPLMHLLRNAVDHGIEAAAQRIAAHKPKTGSITMTVENVNGEIVIHVRDDGQGIDVEQIRKKAQEKKLLKEGHSYTREELLNLILLPGFSTNQTANEFSGRGVGMDVVKTMVDHFKGHVSIQSTLHSGTVFSLHFPLTLTVIESMLFRCSANTFSIPAHHVLHFFPYQEDDTHLKTENGHSVYVYEDKVLPILPLSRFFHMEPSSAPGNILMYVRSSTREACLLVDRIIGYQHIVDKPLPMLLHTQFKKGSGISGCSLLGDGSICLTLNTEYLLDCLLYERCMS